jgi:hypothetical protein
MNIPVYINTVCAVSTKIAFTGNNTQFNKSDIPFNNTHSKHVAKTAMAIVSNLYIAIVKPGAMQHQETDRVINKNTGAAFFYATMVSKLITGIK